MTYRHWEKGPERDAVLLPPYPYDRPDPVPVGLLSLLNLFYYSPDPSCERVGRSLGSTVVKDRSALQI